MIFFKKIINNFLIIDIEVNFKMYFFHHAIRDARKRGRVFAVLLED